MRLHQIALSLLVTAAPALGANLVTNGSFESATTGSFTVTGPASQNGDTVITQWGLSGSDGGVSVYPSPPDGSQIAFLDANSTLYQDDKLLLTKNTTYTLTLFARQTGDQPATVGDLTVSLLTGTADLNSVVNLGSLTPGNSTTVTPGSSFGSVTLTFTTGSSVSGDLFVALTNTPETFNRRTSQLYLDDVVVMAPEPATAALLGISSLSLLARRRRED